MKRTIFLIILFSYCFINLNGQTENAFVDDLKLDILLRNYMINLIKERDSNKTVNDLKNDYSNVVITARDLRTDSLYKITYKKEGVFSFGFASFHSNKYIYLRDDSNFNFIAPHDNLRSMVDSIFMYFENNTVKYTEREKIKILKEALDIAHYNKFTKY